MKFTASRTALALLAAGALVLTGCADKKSTDATSTTTATSAQNGASGSPTAKPSVDANGLPTVQIVKDAALATRETYSEHLTLAVDKGIKGLPVTSVTGDIISFKDTKRVAAQGEANVVTDDKGTMAQTKFVVIDGMMYADFGGAKYRGIGKTGEKGVYDPAIILDQEKGLAKILDALQNPKVEGKDTVNGLKTVKVSGTVDTHILDPLLPQITDIAQRGNAGTNLPITLWIVFDASADPMPKPNVTRMEVKLKELPITLNLTEFGKDVKIEKPAT
ncbi:LppX_LprAFG lipoprotein [Tsukamurella pseudospumae]|uniref:LppX_LprAFG lipoprotein n=1 Tax=Tsukamurella pseudospumae TaxID=239498 RepID=A0A138AXD9_9ACTN|nr:LppX_LprAFG lipoprotein [Tsukamurella pseudospumae]KXP15118.1 hypothetical protein AXK60_04460 [Tsukamurella pseudospumae]